MPPTTGSRCRRGWLRAAAVAGLVAVVVGTLPAVATTAGGALMTLVAAVSVAWATRAASRADERVRLAHTELKRCREDFARLDRLEANFVAMASHELRTPLTSIQGAALTLARHGDALSDEGRRRSIDVIHRQANRLARLVDDLLVSSEIESGSLHHKPEVVTVGGVIADAAHDAGVHEGIRARGELDLEVSVDRAHLRRILATFLANADRYGRPPIEVEVAAGGGVLQITVRDHGNGVPPEFRPQLFDRFAQASTGMTRTAVGAGLGLSVASGLARTAGGDVYYKAPVDGGALFGVRLPAATRGRSAVSPDPVTRQPSLITAA